MTNTIYHEDDSVTIVLSEQMVDFFAKDILDDGGNIKIKGETRVIIQMTAEEHENLERHAREYIPPAPLLPHELAKMFKDDDDLPKYLDEKKKAILKKKVDTQADDIKLKKIYHKHVDKPILDYYEEKNVEYRNKLQQEIDETDRLLAFMGRGGSRKIKNFQRDLTEAKAYPIDKLLDYSRNRLQAQCVWHEDHNPSLHYYKKNNTVWCFACGHGGDAIDVVRQMNQCSLTEAINFLKGRA